jgi:uncharacterized protein YdhG (YjbR/CyaY superfamily)
MRDTPPRTIDEYIADCKEPVQRLLNELRQAILQAAPDAQETISYQMPAFRLSGNLVYFAACKNHIGFYPTSSGIEAFRSELSAYKTSQGAVQFPLNQPLPLDLVRRMVKYRVEVNLQKLAAKKPKKYSGA